MTDKRLTSDINKRLGAAKGMRAEPLTISSHGDDNFHAGSPDGVNDTT
jgi:hypothetical protein